MVPRRPRRRRLTALPRAASLAGVAVFALLCLAGPAHAARLAGGARRTAIVRAFSAGRGHRGAIVASVRTSTAAPAWSIVKWVGPTRASGSHGRVPPLRSAFYRAVGAGERPGAPPAAARSDLDHRFTLDVTYAGSGSESITDDQQTAGVCPGLGGFQDDQTDDVTPMRWRVRYEVDPDDLLSAIRGPAGTVLVPRTRFLAAGSSLTATERLTLSIDDVSCARKTKHSSCVQAWHLDPSQSLLGFAPTGMTIGIPKLAKATGMQCAASDYTLGPSLWSQDASTALVRELRLVGPGPLPDDPYTPLRVAWPTNAASEAGGFGQDPCASDPECTDRFAWSGTVTVSPGAGG